MSEIWTDEETGAPVMLARAPGQVAAQPASSGVVKFRGAASGNANFDPITGKFAGKKLKGKVDVVAQTVQSGAPVFRSGIPTGVDPLVWERRMDTVRDAARQKEMMTAKSATTFLTGRVADVSLVDMNAFLNDVSEQRVDDLADAMDQKLKPTRGKSDVKVAASAGWMKSVLAQMTPAQNLHFVKRLEGRGWSPEDINKLVVSKIRDPARKKALQQLYGEDNSGDKTSPK